MKQTEGLAAGHKSAHFAPSTAHKTRGPARGRMILRSDVRAGTVIEAHQKKSRRKNKCKNTRTGLHGWHEGSATCALSLHASDTNLWCVRMQNTSKQQDTRCVVFLVWSLVFKISVAVDEDM